MKVLSAAERRLIAALDRLDHAVEHAAQRMAEGPEPPPDVEAAPATPSDAAVSPDIAALHDRQAATLEAMQARLAEADDRLAAAGEQAARLAAANEELAQANRALIEAAGGPDAWADSGEVATFAALQAEVEALRAARAAEIAQMGEILDSLDRMLGFTTVPRSHSTEDRQRIGEAEAADAEALMSDGPAATDQSADDPAGFRELSVIRDEDPLPEDEPGFEAEMPEEIRFGQGHDEDAEEEPR